MDFFTTIFNAFAELLKEVLPTSPFREFLDRFSEIEYLGYLNWFVPVGDIIVVMELWLGAVSAYYLYSVVMRWVKVIGD